MRTLRHALGALFVVCAINSAQAQLMEQPIRIVFPFPAGGASDALVRMLAESMHTSLGRRVIVENKAGAGGRLGVQAVKEAPADGNVLLFTPLGPMTIFPHVYDKLGYDPVADFQPVSQVATFEMALAVGRDVPANSIDELLKWLKANPARASYGSPAAGSMPHFFGVQLARITQLDLQHVAYKGSPPALTDLAGGHLPTYVGPTLELVEAHNAGRIKVLATSGAERSPALPNVPTFTEAGYAIRGEVWFGVYAPARTPADVIERLNKAIVSAVQEPGLKSRMLALGIRPSGTSSAELAKIQQADLERWGPIVKASGFRSDQ